MAAARPPYASTSLYVGDLSPEVTEATLYEFFNSVGPVASIRVCRDATSRRSLGYAYVNYHSIADAERALDTLNYTAIKGTPCRIMWSQRDPTLRKAATGNLFVKNLDKAVDNRALHDTFSLFGNILSCKVVTDENGKSRGYGMVHFETEEAAQSAIERGNGMKIGSKEIYVGPFFKRAEHPSGKPDNFTNVYCRNFSKNWTEDIVRKVFSQCGEITSVWLSADKHGRPFVCVNYASAHEAKNAVGELNGKKVDAEGICADQSVEPTPKKADGVVPEDGASSKATDVPADEKEISVLFVDRAQDRSERGVNGRTVKMEKQNAARPNKYEGVNLYIKNLADNIDDAGLRAMFEPYGTITSAKIMRDEDSHSKGFGFVCLSTADEATKAIADLHLQVHEGKPLYVGLAEQKDRRQARLQQHFRSSAAVRNNQNNNAMNYPAPNAFFNSGVMPNNQVMWPTYQQPAAPGVMWKPTAFMPPMAAGYPQGANAYRAVPAQGPRGGMQPVPVRPAADARADKQLLGEQLFPLVAQRQPSLAGKITGMMLDMTEEEIRELISNPRKLDMKIAEALYVLNQAQHA